MNGPVRFNFQLADTPQLDMQILALRRFAALRHHGHVPASLMPRPANLARRILLIRTLDALASSPHRRAVAIALFGEARVKAEWVGRSEHLKSRVRRLITDARRLAAGGYRDLFKPRHTRFGAEL